MKAQGNYKQAVDQAIWVFEHSDNSSSDGFLDKGFALEIIFDLAYENS